MVANTMTTLLATAIVGGALAATQAYYSPAFPWVIGFMLACLAGRVLSHER